MSKAEIIDGKASAAALRGRISHAVAALRKAHDVTPGLAVMLVGDDPASQVYVKTKIRKTDEVGIRSFEHYLPADTSQADLLALVARLNADNAVHGILVQLPLPDGIDENAVLQSISPDKDIDGLHALNAGRLLLGHPGIIPCTPLGVSLLLRECFETLAGLEVVVVGRSNLSGKPMAQLLLQAHATVTMAHSRTKNLPDVCRRGDILVVATGRPEMARGDWIKPGATVIDVGITRREAADGKATLLGDVCFAEAVEVAGAITPVPGGVGPMTIACLLHNTLAAACLQLGVSNPL